MWRLYIQKSLFFSVIILQCYMTIGSDEPNNEMRLQGMTLKATLNFVKKSSMFKDYADRINYLQERVAEIEGEPFADLSQKFSMSPGRTSPGIKKKLSGLNISPKTAHFRKVYDNVMQAIQTIDSKKTQELHEYNRSIGVVTMILTSKYGYQQKDVFNQDRLTPSIEMENEK